MAVVPVRIGKLQYYAAGNIPVPHAFTTRLGGVSQGYLASLNLGLSRGDERANVVENFRILGSALGFRPEDVVLTHQTHTDRVIRVDGEDRGRGLFAPEFPECDGLITNTPGVTLVVFTADCTPVLLYDPVTGAVGAAHAGWRGTAADIAGKTVRAMEEAFGSRPEDLRAAIGPNIGQCCFETGEEVPQAMADALGPRAWAYAERRNDKYYVNLKALNAQFLARAGVRDIQISDLCTACRTDLFWSYRRMGKARGSQGALIQCKEVCV